MRERKPHKAVEKPTGSVGDARSTGLVRRRRTGPAVPAWRAAGLNPDRDAEWALDDESSEEVWTELDEEDDR
ncbi:hypothetical protein [Streptomyces scabiei]|uniref:hypothetical protein n=1 Tax=Streptomyces scabiei TaxID=1930 RepID=UPI0029B767CC|nr:hypothetical protein [Streptomyces scabiei]MDX3522054.1 hypothetical protein [Streptomyces scabiei]